MEMISKLKKENILIFSLFTLIILFPISYLLGNSVINLFLFLISLTYLFYLIKNKKIDEFKKSSFLILFTLWITFLINLFVSQNFDLSLNRVLKFIFIIFFVSAIKFIISYKDYFFENFIYKIWSLFFLIVLFDLVFEYIFGHNILGNKSYMPGRLTGFLDGELVIGYYFIGFALFAFIFLDKEIDNKNYTVFILITFILVSFIIGERSNFIKFFISSLVFFLIFYEINLKKKIIGVLITVSIFSILFFTISNDNIYKTRFINQMPNLLEKNGIKKFMLNSTYGSHYNTALSVFKNNIIFGVGIKNYRDESIKKIYTDKNKDFKFQIMGTHPHQIHLELLSETGIFGYLSFFSFIIYSLYLSLSSFLKSKNYYQLAAILFVICSLIPLLPSGSFFSTYTSVLFWFNYAIMMAYTKN